MRFSASVVQAVRTPGVALLPPVISPRAERAAAGDRPPPPNRRPSQHGRADAVPKLA